ncbi:MAG: Ig-like domain-containing protein [Bacilli bacterium]
MKNRLILASLLTLGATLSLGSCDNPNVVESEIKIEVTGSNEVNMGDELLLSAEVSNLENYIVEWSSSNEEVASVTQGGVVTAHTVTKDTKVVITASVKGYDVKFDFEITVKFVDVVNEVIVSISGASSVKAGSTIQLVANVQNATNTNVVWTSSNEGVATVDANGVVTANGEVAEDTAVTITATSVEDNTKQATKIVNVIAKDVPLPIEIFVDGADHVTMGSTTTLTAHIEHATNDAVQWTSSDESIATVDANGVVTALTKDHNTEVTITVTSVEDPTKYASHTLEVWVGANKLDDYYVYQIQPNKNYVAYKANGGVIAGNEDQQFSVMNENYVVGDDNYVDLKPVTKFFNTYDENDDPIASPAYTGDWIYDITIYLKNDDSSYTEIDASSSSQYIDQIDNVHCQIDFSDNAIGKEFKITVEPGKLTTGQKGDPDYNDYYVVNYECIVDDGYNVYNSSELSYIDNRTDEYGQAWNELKTANGLSTSYWPSKLILQSNISIVADDLPSLFYMKKGDTDFPSEQSEEDQNRIDGSLRDWVTIYKRWLDRNSSFDIIGNYFTLDASSIPVILCDENDYTEEGGLITTNSELMYIQSRVSSTAINTDAPTSTLKNFYMKGNAPRVEDSTKGGGLIFSKHQSVKTVFENMISRAWFTSFNPVANHFDEFSIDKCKAFDSYSNFVYCYGALEVNIDDCYFSGCGGPAIIADDVTNKQTTHQPSNIYINNSVINAFVAGTEGWFQGYEGAVDAATSIKSLSALFEVLGNKTFARQKANDTSEIPTTYMNFICLHKDGSAEAMSSSYLTGELKIDDNETFVLDGTNESSYYYMSTQYKSPLFQSAKGGFGFYNGSVLVDNPLTANAITDSSHDLYQGDYLALFFDGMMVTLGYYTAGTTLD